MRTLRLTLQYDGRNYVGWQRQENGRSIQELLERAFEPIEGRMVPVVGAGRTDAGVHALGQVASVQIAHDIDCASLVRALNARLPEDVVVIDATEAPEGFHARFNAAGKRYRYRIVNAEVMSPFERGRAWHVPLALDVEVMNAATRPLVGEHDFAAFQAAGSSVRTTVRTIRRAVWTQVPPDPAWQPLGARSGRLVLLEVEGDGFLRHMVRILVGTAVEVGAGRRWPGTFTELLDTRDRGLAGPTAPPDGLFLAQVLY